MEGRFVPAPKHTNDLKATLWRNIFAHLIWSSYAAYLLYKTICLLRGGRGVKVISEKNILQTDSREKKVCKGYPTKKNRYTEKKNLSWQIMLAKKYHTLVCQEKKLYHQRFGEKIGTQTKSPISPSPLPQKSNGGPLTSVL